MILSINQIEIIFSEGIIFLAYMLICVRIADCRFSKKRALAAGGIVAGTVLVQAAFLLYSQDITLVLTLLPITAYLPAAIGFYLISRPCFAQIITSWSTGITAALILKALKRMSIWYFNQFRWPFWWMGDLLISIAILFAAGLIVFLTFRFLSDAFQVFEKENKTNWLYIFFPILIMILMLSYFNNSIQRFETLFLPILLVLSVFILIVGFLLSSADMIRIKKSEKALAFRIQMQRQEYEEICKKLEAGRIYRHDMRHHISVLEELAKQEHAENILEYLENMNGHLSKTEREVYCENITVNAVLSSCIGQAKNAGCVVSAKVNLPEEISIDDIDICMVLANAIENAANACRKIEDKNKRYIHIEVKFLEQQKLIVSVKNSCEGDISFDANGYPAVPRARGHGIGLKSIQVITEKYNGCFRCECSEGEFRFYAVMFCMQESPIALKRERKSFWKRLSPALSVSKTVFFVLVCCEVLIAWIFLGFSDVKIPIRTARIQSQTVGWGDTVFEVTYPVLAIADEAEGEQEAGRTVAGNAVQKDDGASDGASSKNKLSTDSNLPRNKSTAEAFSQDNASAGTEVPKDESSTGRKSLEGKNGGKDMYPKDGINEDRKPSQNKNNVNDTLPKNEGMTVKIPQLETMDGVEDLSKKINEYIAEMRKKFMWYVSHKYEGYVSADTDYQVRRNDDDMLVIYFFSTINVGGSVNYSRNFILDKKNGRVLELSDLFLENSDYRKIISQDILRQMEERVQNNEGRYFIPGGIWSESQCFKQIAQDQNFYLNEQNQLVIVFDEYEVAPGSMGMPEFVIDTAILGNILKKPSFLR